MEQMKTFKQSDGLKNTTMGNIQAKYNKSLVSAHTPASEEQVDFFSTLPGTQVPKNSQIEKIQAKYNKSLVSAQTLPGTQVTKNSRIDEKRRIAVILQASVMDTNFLTPLF